MSPLSIRYYTTALVVLLCLSSTTGVNVLFPYGPDAGDQEWQERVYDDFLNVEFSNQSFPFAGVPRNNITIDNHGNLNFAGKSDYGNQLQYADLDIIAASWDDYQREPVSSQTHLYYRETMDPALLFDISLYVRQIHGVQEFWPTWAFIVTYENYKHYQLAELDFQIIIAADGEKSYAVFLYGTQFTENTPEVGVNDYNETADANMYDKLCKNADETKTLVFRKQSKCQGQPGIVSFRTDVIEDPGQCRDTYEDMGCSSDSDCNSTNPFHCPFCDIGLGTCVECRVDGDCSTTDKPHCDISIGWCVPCTADEHCQDPNLPHCDSTVDRMCKECVVHNHCTQDPNRSCSADKQCTGCLSDTDCGSNRLCDLNKQQCVCQADNVTCNEYGMACDASGQCGCSDGFVSIDGTCTLGCLSDDDCGSNRKCNLETWQCVCQADNKPCDGYGMECKASGHCGCLEGHIYVDGSCPLDCDPPCAYGETCSVERKCLKHCVDPDSCPYGTRSFSLHGCAKRGQLGGYCHYGRCYGKNVICNRRTKRCICRGRCNKKLVCDDRR